MIDAIVGISGDQYGVYVVRRRADGELVPELVSSDAKYADAADAEALWVTAWRKIGECISEAAGKRLGREIMGND